MLKKEKIKHLPDQPGVYWFKRGKEILYLGKAASLRDRVRSYFPPAELGASRGPRLVQMMALATGVGVQVTDSVLEALLLEARLIKKYQPKYNVKAKDDKSYWSVVITDEEYPRVLMIRGQILPATSYQLKAIYGPFPNASELRAALKVMRKIFPFRDYCQPNAGKPCFNHQLDLCPGVCVGKISVADYQKIIKQITLFLLGRKPALLKQLRQAMSQAARRQEFEEAVLERNKISALEHFQDVGLIKTWKSDFQVQGSPTSRFRIESYDIAHLGGSNAVGVMVVAENGELMKSEYRKFKVSHGADDLANLREVLERRLAHSEWSRPDLIVVDGGANQLMVAKTSLAKVKIIIPIVSVVKDERHRPKQILRPSGTHLNVEERRLIFQLNVEAHRFAISYHRQRRKKLHRP
ncbi:MAG: UvrB/UvrC motif-containing protein [Candidatus Vogelbacteria bacterium]|nr:UvrB/UvrC motif-containing protein [Candidatus Vogelbacteria bacterium]